MKAFVKTGRSPYEGGLREVEVESPGVGEALIKVDACGICGSDLHAYASDVGFEWVEPPVILGHEFAGTVEEVGSGVLRAAPGDRVVPIAIQGCGFCEFCRKGSTQLCANKLALGLHQDGGMAEYALVSTHHLVAVPPELDLAVAALCEPLAVAVHTVNSRSDINPGSTVVVSGPGPIGILCALVASRAGAHVVVTGLGADSESRLPAAYLAGLQTANVGEASLDEHLQEKLGTTTPDAWIESSGSVSALESALASVRPGGRVTVVGLYSQELAFSPTMAVRREIDVWFSYSCNYADYRTALDLLTSRALEPRPLVSTYPLEQAPQAFEDAREAKAVKALLSTRANA